jgi:hypothetical protein
LETTRSPRIGIIDCWPGCEGKAVKFGTMIYVENKQHCAQMERGERGL